MPKIGLKNNLKTLLLFIVFTLVILGALILLKDCSQEGKLPTYSGGEDSSDEDETSKPFAVEELTPAQKAERDSNALKDALFSGDTEDCESILYNQEMKERCLDNVNYAKIIKTGDEKQCDVLFNKELRQKCYDDIYFIAAVDSLDVTLCEKIKDETVRSDCTSQIRVVLGRTAESAEGCDSISDPMLKQECLNNYYLSEGINQLDETSCDNIEDATLKERCSKTVTDNIKVVEASKEAAELALTTAVSSESLLENCNLYPADKAVICKDRIYYDLAFERKDIAYCNKVIDATKKQSCVKEQTEKLDQYYLRQAMSKKTPSLCDKISNTSVKSLCLDSI